MKNDLLFNFSVNKKTNTISVQREFAAELALVWDAWTIPKIVDQWWGSKEWVSTTKSMEFKEGGQRFYVMRGPAGEEHWGITTYESILLHTSFSGKDCFSDESGQVNNEFPVSDYHVSFKTLGAKTRIEHLTTYSSLEQLEASLQYGFEEGMIKAFEGMDALLFQMNQENS